MNKYEIWVHYACYQIQPHLNCVCSQAIKKESKNEKEKTIMK